MSTATTAKAVGSGFAADADELIGRHLPGHALERQFYIEPQIFEREMDRMILRHWFCAAHASAVPRPGDFVVVSLGSESIILVRTQDAEIRALLNVCRHRGSRICTTPAGTAVAGRFTCPYHAWTYDLNGRLVAARQMPEELDRCRLGLKSLPIRVVGGLVFTTFAERPLNFAPAEEALARVTRLHGWAKAKVAHRQTYSIKANWKLAVENYMECYHCQPAHPEFTKRHIYARPPQQASQREREGRRRAEALGIFMQDVDEYGCAAKPGSESVSVFRSALTDGVASATADSKPIARLMGEFPDHDGNSTYFDVGPLSDFLAYADYGVIYRFIPITAEHTEMELIWLVHEDAIQGQDYDVDRLTWLWNTTSLEDKRIVELNQAGVNSRFFEPGPYSLQEAYARRFVDWYLRELATP